MIDTINFRIHNLKNYVQIYNQFYTLGKNAVTQIYIDEDTGEVTERNKVHSLFYHDNNNVVPLSQRNSLHIASSHYSVSYFINQNQNWIDFNISVPKFVFGTNIYQFIDYFDVSSSSTFLYFRRFIEGFFKKNFLQLPGYEDVEITRIDLCFNHHFNNRLDSLTYLEEQKKLLTKYARSTRNDFRTYDTSWMYKTQRYTFKCYHKGEEFIRNDLKKLEKNNPLNHDLGFLIEQSSKILRYEITIRPAHIKYLITQAFVESKVKTKIQYYRNHVVSRFLRQLKTLPSENHYKKFIQFSCKLTLKSVFDTTSNCKHLTTAESITFDEVIFRLLYDDFFDKIQRFQLNKKPSTAETLAMLRHRKKKAKDEKKKQDNSLLVMATLLSSYHSMNELYKTNLLPKSTYHKVRKQLQEYGINDASDNLEFSPPPINYDDYRRIFGSTHLQFDLL